jgi:hypothetical protein
MLDNVESQDNIKLAKSIRKGEIVSLNESDTVAGPVEVIKPAVNADDDHPVFGQFSGEHTRATADFLRTQSEEARELQIPAADFPRDERQVRIPVTNTPFHGKQA